MALSDKIWVYFILNGWKFVLHDLQKTILIDIEIETWHHKLKKFWLDVEIDIFDHKFPAGTVD